MSKNSYEDIKHALLAARSRNGDDRTAFLRELASRSSTLAAEVRSLLAHEDSSIPEVSAGWIASAMSPMAPDATGLGSYPIEGEIGRGGAGVVYLARDPVLDRRIALKVLPREVADRPDRLLRFREEARLLASINHPNIATIHELQAEHRPPFMAMEFVEGETLARKIARGSLSVVDGLAVSEQIARALEAAHGEGVVHRDLKPANVMITSGGLVKVVDFGLAVGARTEDGLDGTSSVSFVEGTPGYMSPEQIERETIDHRTDVWAFGCVLFECFAGEPAFGSGSLLDRMTRAREGDLDWNRLPAALPVSIHELLRSCLLLDAGARPESMSRVREDIEEAIFRLRMARLRAEPRSSQFRVPHNLPPIVDTFVGRERELANVVADLEKHRLVTLTGTGGTGKTRLGLEAARTSVDEFEDGIWFVDLARLTSPSGVAGEVARSLGLGADASLDAAQRLVVFLADRRALLILDNCEHVRHGCVSLVENLIRACDRVSILATSRQRLGLAGEVPVSVAPLHVDVPSGEARSPRSEAAQLFLDRAMTASPEFDGSTADVDAVDEICRRVEGMPLAIELAAARVRALTVNEIAERLADRFALLGNAGAVEHETGPIREDRTPTSARHRSLHALIDWTFRQLSITEQTIFRRLSVFRGGWTLAAAETVCSGDGVPAWDFLEGFIQLVEKSLVYRDVEGESIVGRSRYRMFETIREFGSDRLREANEETATTSRYTTFFLGQAEEARAKIMGPEQAEWVKRLDADYANHRQVLTLGLADRHEPATAVRLAAALGDYWQIRGYFQEAAESYALALDMPESRDDPGVHARLLSWAGNIALARGRFDESRQYHEASVATCRESGNARGLGGSMNGLGVIAWKLGDIGSARHHYEEAARIWEELADERLVGVARNNLGVLDMETGEYASARVHFGRSIATHERLGNRHAVGVLQANIGLAAMYQGEYDDAHDSFERSLEIRRELGDRAGIAHSLNGIGSVLERRGDPDAARPWFEESLVLYEEVGDLAAATVPLINLGFVEFHRADLAEAEARFRRAREMSSEAGDAANVARSDTGLGMVTRARGRPREAARLLRRGLDGLLAVEDRWGVTLALEHVVPLFEQTGKPEAAARVLGFLEAERRSLNAPRTVLQRAEHDRTMTKLASQLSADELARECATGSALSLAQVIELARTMDVEEP